MIKGVAQKLWPAGVEWNQGRVESAHFVCLWRHGQRGEGGAVDLAVWDVLLH